MFSKAKLSSDDKLYILQRYGLVRNVYIYVLYGQGNGKDKENNSYALKDFSRVYVDYVVNNLEDILSDAVTFGVHNSLAFESKDVYDSVRIFSKDENETKKEQILFSYLLKRGTGISFKYLLYNYAQKYYEILSKEDAEFYYDSMDRYLQYMTAFKQVCLFPDEAFFEEVYKMIILLMKSKAAALKEEGAEVKEQDMYLAFLYKLNEILYKLCDYQEKAISSGGESPEFEFPNFTFEKPNDRTAQYVNLWNDVQRYVNTYVMCENPLYRFDMEVHNNLDMYNTVIEGLNGIRSQINALKSRYRML